MESQETVLSQPQAAAKRHARDYDPAAEIVAPRHLKLVTGLAPVTCWRLRRAGLFPQALRLSVGRIGWRRADLEAWLRARAQAGK
jgi:predicted DNA-binding transcriptional regulator AlpA